LLRQVPLDMVSQTNLADDYIEEIISDTYRSCVVTEFSQDIFEIVHDSIVKYLKDISQDIETLKSNLQELQKTRIKIQNALDSPLQQPLLPGDLTTKEGPKSNDYAYLPTKEHLLEAQRINEAETRRAEGMKYRLSKEQDLYEWRKQQIDTRKRLWIMRDRLLGVLKDIHVSYSIDGHGPKLFAPDDGPQVIGKITPLKRKPEPHTDDSEPIPKFPNLGDRNVLAMEQVFSKTEKGDKIEWIIPAPKVKILNDNLKIDKYIARAVVSNDVEFPIPAHLASQTKELHAILLQYSPKGKKKKLLRLVLWLF